MSATDAAWIRAIELVAEHARRAGLAEGREEGAADERAGCADQLREIERGSDEMAREVDRVFALASSAECKLSDTRAALHDATDEQPGHDLAVWVRERLSLILDGAQDVQQSLAADVEMLRRVILETSAALGLAVGTPLVEAAAEIREDMAALASRLDSAHAVIDDTRAALGLDRDTPLATAAAAVVRERDVMHAKAADVASALGITEGDDPVAVAEGLRAEVNRLRTRPPFPAATRAEIEGVIRTSSPTIDHIAAYSAAAAVCVLLTRRGFDSIPAADRLPEGMRWDGDSVVSDNDCHGYVRAIYTQAKWCAYFRDAETVGWNTLANRDTRAEARAALAAHARGES